MHCQLCTLKFLRSPLPAAHTRKCSTHVQLPINETADLSVTIQFVSGHAVESALLVPWQPWKAMDSPTETDGVIILLPDPLHFHIQLLEKQIPVKSEAPEYELVVIQAIKSVSWVAECDIVSIYVICRLMYPYSHH